jgi:single-strand DNA-binding protein
MFALSVLVGRLGRDPELRTTQAGQELAQVSLATSRRIKRESGWEEATEWHNVTLWGQAASFAGEQARKGDLVLVVGEPRSRSWEDAQGMKRQSHEIVVGGPQHVFRRLAGTGDGAGRDERAQTEDEPLSAEAAPADETARAPRRPSRAAASRPVVELVEDLPF